MGVTLDSCLEPSYVLGSNHAVTGSRPECLLTSPLHSHCGPCLRLQYSQCVPRQTLPCLSPLHTLVIVPGEEVGGRTGPGKQDQCNSESFANHSIIRCGLVALRHPPGKQNKQESILQLLPPRSAFLLPRAKKRLVSSGFCCWFGFAKSSSDL